MPLHRRWWWLSAPIRPTRSHGSGSRPTARRSAAPGRRTLAGDHWQDGSAYEGYVGRWSRRVAERFVPWVGIERGATWVDVGCGTGVLTRAIADLASPASVVGIDPSPAFLRTARSSLRDSR